MLDVGHVLRFIKRESWLVSMGGCGTACLVLDGLPQYLRANQWLSQADRPILVPASIERLHR